MLWPAEWKKKPVLNHPVWWAATNVLQEQSVCTYVLRWGKKRTDAKCLLQSVSHQTSCSLRLICWFPALCTGWRPTLFEICLNILCTYDLTFVFSFRQTTFNPFWSGLRASISWPGKWLLQLQISCTDNQSDFNFSTSHLTRKQTNFFLFFRVIFATYFTPPSLAKPPDWNLSLAAPYIAQVGAQVETLIFYNYCNS